MTKPLRSRIKDTVIEDCRNISDVNVLKCQNKLTIQISVSLMTGTMTLIKHPPTSYLHARSGGHISDMVIVTDLCSHWSAGQGVVSGGALMGLWKTS